jgi:hypothetical protein
MKPRSTALRFTQAEVRFLVYLLRSARRPVDDVLGVPEWDRLIGRLRAKFGSIDTRFDGPQKQKRKVKRRPPRNLLVIVKVQVPIVTTEDPAQVLVYSEDRSVEEQFSLTSELSKQLGRRLRSGQLKSFWYARLVPDSNVRGGFQIFLERIAPDQEW